MTMTIHSAAAATATATLSAIAPAGARPNGADASATGQDTTRAPAAVTSTATARARSGASSATSTGAAAATPAGAAAAPMFARLLGVAVDHGQAAEAAPTTAKQETPADERQDPAAGSNPASDTTALLPAMAGSLYASVLPALPATLVTVAAPGTAATGSADTDSADAVPAASATRTESQPASQAVSTLYPAATPFNLSAAGIAVNTATGTTASANYDASQLALAQQARRLTDGAPAPAAAPASGDETAATSAPQGEPAAASTAAATAPAANQAAAALVAAAMAPTASTAPARTTPATVARSAPATASNAAAPVDTIAIEQLARATVRVAAAPASQADAADVATTTSANAASLAGAARDDSQGTGKFATALAGAANAAPAAMVTATPVAGTAAAAVVKLAGAPDQWQQPLREALGDRLQVNLQRNNDHAVIRLDPPNMGSIEISIRHTAGALQVNLSASNSEVVRQLNAIGDNVRQDLSNRQFTEVAVTVSAARAQGQAQADTGRQQREQQEQERGRTPGRALFEDDAAHTFAMNDQE
jgi:flagellar hook-length control protein FliK